MNRKISIIYNISIVILALISVALSIVDITTGLTSFQSLTDNVIYAIFVFDYLIRLFISREKSIFFKTNLLDLVAIIPFNSAFRIFRILKLGKIARLLKLAKLFRFGAYAARVIKHGKRFFNTNGFKYVLILVVCALLFGAFAMMHLEGMTFSDALWWSFVTTTTVGYGDLSPCTGTGRIIASILMLVGNGLIGSLTSTITSFFIHDTREDQNNSSEKVDMVFLLYDSLSESEKESFKKRIY